jgi:hypothetical protein
VKNKKSHPFPHDPETKKAHKVTKLAIKKDPLCEENWWQAEIPKGKDDLVRSHVRNEPET